MYSQQFLVCDNSTLANFKSWAQAISNWFATCGWVQTADTGQVNWASIAAVPGSGAFVYEVWKPGDAYQTFYVKIGYGNASGSANSPTVQITIGMSTDGASNMTGIYLGPKTVTPGAAGSASTTATYECNFSGDSGRIGVMLWRDAGYGSYQQGPTQLFTIERSVDSNGNYYGTSTSGHVTLAVIGYGGHGIGSSYGPTGEQQTILFNGPKVGSCADRSDFSNTSLACFACRVGVFAHGGGAPFNGSIPFDTIAPVIGFFDWPLTMLGFSTSADVAEGVPFTVTLYGNTRTYMPSRNGPLLSGYQFQGATNWGAFTPCMRID